MEEKYICYDCVKEEYLRSKMKKRLIVNCSYCKDELPGYRLGELADCIDIAFQQHYVKSPDSPPNDWSSYRYDNSEWEPAGTRVIYAIADAADISEEIAIDIQQILAERYTDYSVEEMTEYDEDSYYDDKDPEDQIWENRWSEFENSIKSNARFFNKDRERYLESIFNDLESWETKDKHPIVKKIGPGKEISSLYRARVFQSEKKLINALKFPDKELGPPPLEYASAGRMNSRGISVFYGATEASTALAEIRPPVGSKVVVARFTIDRELKVLDLSALKLSAVEGSIFDEEFAEQLSKSKFLRNLSDKLTKPVMPDDEHFDYLITQSIAEFLYYSLKIDGIVFQSAQSGEGLNVTLFHHASRVNTIEVLEETEIDVRLSDWDGFEEVPSYKVVKWLADKTDLKAEDKIIDELPGFYWKIKDPDQREKTLSIVVNSIVVEHIESVKIKSAEHVVTHIEYKKSDLTDD